MRFQFSESAEYICMLQKIVMAQKLAMVFVTNGLQMVVSLWGLWKSVPGKQTYALDDGRSKTGARRNSISTMW